MSMKSQQNRAFVASDLRSTLLTFVDVGLGSVIFIAPLFMGGRQPLGKLVFVLIVCATAIAWLARQAIANEDRWKRSAGEWLILAGGALICLQLLPLPPSLLVRLSPSIADHVPFWNSQVDSVAALGQWSQVSLLPQATKSGLVMFLAYGMLFALVVQRVAEVSDVERLLRWIALAVSGMAVLGLAQSMAGNGKFLWVYEYPYRDTTGPVSGAFSCPNHFAHFLALGLGPLIWWIQRVHHKKSGRIRHSFTSGRRRDGGPSQPMVKFALFVAVGITSFAGLLSLSRGGVLAMFVASLVCIGIYVKRSFLGRKSIFAMVAIGCLVGIAIGISGSQQLMEELGTIMPGSEDGIKQNFAREQIWTAVASAVPHFAILGAGVGSHREVYPKYLSEFSAVEFTHAESGYLQVLMETGIPGLALLLVGIAMSMFWAIQTLRNTKSSRLAACAAAVFAGIVVSALHSIVDFVWHITACMSFAVILVACACRLKQISSRKNDESNHQLVVPRAVWMTACLSLMLLAAVMIKDRLAEALAAPHWEAYVKLELGEQPVSSSHDDDVQGQSIHARMSHLQYAVARNPNDARTHVRLARLALQKFELAQKTSVNPMNLADIRSAVWAANFRSRDDRDRWLAVAVGKNKRYLDRALFHVRRGLQLCPLQGEGYALLASLSFLQDSPASENKAYIEAALRLRPQSGTVLVAAGSDAALAGDLDKAMTYWNRAFHQGGEEQSQIISWLAPLVPATVFQAQFDPDLNGLERVFQEYRKIGRVEDARLTAKRLAELVESSATSETGVVASRLWNRAHAIHSFLQNGHRSLACLRNSVAAAPNDFSARRSYATELLKQERFEQAIEQLVWCLRRESADDGLRNQLAQAKRSLVESTNRPLAVAE